MKPMKKKKMKLEVTNAILAFMTNGLAFTALDICNYVRDQNPNVKARYFDISSIVKKSVLNLAQTFSYQYNASLQTVDSDGSPILAYVYHHMDFDPENYLSRDQTTLQTL